MVKFSLVRDEASALFAEIQERAKETRPVMRMWGAFLKAGAQAAFVRKAPPKAASTLAKEAKTGTSSVTAEGKVRASYARQLDQKLKRKGSDEARAELRQLLTGNLSRGSSGNRTVDRLRRRLQAAQAAKSIGAKLAIGKRKSEKTTGRGGRMAGAFKVFIDGLVVRVRNMARYSEVHDQGGKVGNGATLPPWEFMEISEPGAEKLADIALDWLLKGRE